MKNAIDVVNEYLNKNPKGDAVINIGEFSRLIMFKKGLTVIELNKKSIVVLDSKAYECEDALFDVVLDILVNKQMAC